MGDAAFTYDPNGNLTADGTRTYGYDIENRLVSVSNGAALSYDPLGRLYQVSLGASTTRFLYDGDALVAEHNTAGALSRRYVHDVGADVPLASYAGNTLNQPSYHHADHQGSIVALTDASGTAAVNAYDEYGIPAAGNAGRFQYTGQLWLAEIGMYHYKARVYSPTLGRFLQTDPVGYQDQFNLYAYVGNDPVNMRDPSGRHRCDTQKDCRAARTGIREIRAARNFYRSAPVGSRLARSEGAARALDKVLGTLGPENGRGITIQDRILMGNERSSYNPAGDGTITLDTAEIRAQGYGIGESLGHEVQHHHQRGQNPDRIAREVRPMLMEYIIGRAPGGSIGRETRDENHYLGYRLPTYCTRVGVGGQICRDWINDAIRVEGAKPF